MTPTANSSPRSDGPTGEVRTHLARRDWPNRRLDELGQDSIVGLTGELPTTKEVPDPWRQFSECLHLDAHGEAKGIHTITELQRPGR